MVFPQVQLYQIVKLKEKVNKGRNGYQKKAIFLQLFFFEINQKLSLKKITKFNVFLIKNIISQLINKKITIKYPNDLLINKKKVSGLLQEIIFNNNKKYLIFGVGINILNSPNIYDYGTTFLNKYTKNKINKRNLFEKIRKNLILNSKFFFNKVL